MPATVDPINALSVLSLLQESPRSGYEIKQLVDDRLRGVVEITSGTVYYTLKWLERKGWAKGSVSRNGRRPERRLYRISSAGRRAFVQLLEEVAFQRDRFYSPFDVALFFAPHLPADTMLRAVEKRLEEVARHRDALRRAEEAYPVRWPYHLYYLREKAKEIADCNERWCVRLKRKIQDRSESMASSVSEKQTVGRI